MNQIFMSAAKLALICSRLTKMTIQVGTSSISKYSTKNEASFEICPYKLHRLNKGPATKVILTSKDALKLYQNLTVIRRMETAAGTLYKDKVIRGFCHLYSGEEAIAVGMHSVMRDTDTVISSYRCHAWTHLMGASVSNVLSELTGRKAGCSRSKGGSMHMYSTNFYGGNGIVGAQVPLGTGLSFAHKYKGNSGVSFTLYGDGAANQGQVFESFNIAKLWELPCVYVCENNMYGMGTRADRAAASINYYTRGDYVPGIWVDGMDVIATREATRFAIDYCTRGKGPLVLEMETYRYGGHSMSDPGTSYRSREEIQTVRNTRDPINCFKEKILNAELVTLDQLKAIESKVRNEVDKAIQQAKAEPSIGVEEISADVYKLCLEVNNQIRGIKPDTPLKHISIAKQ